VKRISAATCSASTASILRLVLLGIVAAMPLIAVAQPHVLVYTRNYRADGKGHVHENIPASVAAIGKMGAEKGFAVDVSDDPATFTGANLTQYAALVFSNSNDEAFATDAQRDTFKHYIESGSGFVGIHSASGSERDWPNFWSVLGGKFVVHPKMQTFAVQVADPLFPPPKAFPHSSSGPTNAISSITSTPTFIRFSSPIAPNSLRSISSRSIPLPFPILCPLPGITTLTAAGNSISRLDTTKRIMRILCSMESSKTASCGQSAPSIDSIY